MPLLRAVDARQGWPDIGGLHLRKGVQPGGEKGMTINESLKRGIVSLVVLGAALLLLLYLILPPPTSVPVSFHTTDAFGQPIDITDEVTSHYFMNTTDGECSATDKYYTTFRYICVKRITPTTNQNHIDRGADKIVTTYFTEIDGNTMIIDSQVTPLSENHLYQTYQLTQAGYCRGPSLITSAVDMGIGSCDGSSNCHGYPMGWVNGTRIEVCEG